MTDDHRVKSSSGRVHGRKALLTILALLLVVGVLPTALNAQDPANSGTATLEQISNSMTPKYAAAAEAESDTSIAGTFDATLNAINGVAFKYLLFDLSFGSLQSPKEDAEGNTVYTQDPVTHDLAADTKVQRIDDEGNLVFSARGEPVMIEMKAGATVQRINAQGELETIQGDPETEGPKMPFLVVFLGLGAVFFTFWHRGIVFAGFTHSVDIVRGKYTNPNDPGDIPPFRALTSALSATVGLGNIAGVAIAMVTGGPGALFWMMFLGFFGMSAKFHESTLAQVFRTTNDDGTISGGPMYYLRDGIAKHKPSLAGLGKVLAIVFAVFCMAASLGGGNMFQSNQSFEGFYETFVAEDSLALAAAGEMTDDELRDYASSDRVDRLILKNSDYAGLSQEDAIAKADRDVLMQVLDLSAIETHLRVVEARKTLSADAIRQNLTDAQLVRLNAEEVALADDDLTDAERNAAIAGIARESITDEQVAILIGNEELVEAEGIINPVEQDTDRRATQEKRFAIGYGLLLSAVVALVVIGGITRIGAATSKIVPAMCLLYVGGCLTVVLSNASMLPGLIGLVMSEAFAGTSIFGGFLGAMMVGFQRAAFSSEAGLGSSAIAHSAAQTTEPVREGFVASLEPFIDTIVICFLTGMTVLITNAYIAPQFAGSSSEGAAVTLLAFKSVGALSGWFPYLLAISIMLFAFSTMISWCYYGERAWGYLFGLKTVLVFRLMFVACVFIGAVAALGPVLDFSDVMLLSMCLPNILGGIILAPMVKRKVTDYWAKYKGGEFDESNQGPDTTGSDI